MSSVFETSAEQVINRDPVTATTEESISQIKNRMEEHDLRAIPVVNEEGDFEGVISYRELVRFVQFNPEITAPEKMMHQPPQFELDDNLVELSDLRINSGRKMLVHVENGKLAGIVGDEEFLHAFEGLDELEQVSTGRLVNRDVITVDADESLDRARHLMLDNNISRVPVLDSEGDVTGIIDSTDILGMMIKQDRQPAGGTSGGRSGDKVYLAGGNESEEMSEVTADQLMHENYSSASEHMTGLEAIDQMLDEDQDVVLFVDDGYPEAILTLKDLVGHIADYTKQQTILVQLTGIDIPEEKAVIHEKLKKQLQGSLGRKLEKPQEMTLRIKKSEKDGKRHRWELDLKLVSEYGVTNVNEEGWELPDALDEALEQLNRIIRDQHEKKTEHR